MRKNYDDPIPEPPLDPLVVDPTAFRTEQRLARLRATIERRQPTLHLVMEDVHDPHNVSAVLRTCEAVGVGMVHLVYVEEKFPKIGRTSSASAWKWVNIQRYDSIEECYGALRLQGCQIYATDLSERAQSLYTLDLASPVALVFGNEHRGVSPQASSLADGNLLIPMTGLVQSLNISVACAVTLYEAYRQREAAGLYAKPQFPPEMVESLVMEWARK
ncbi:MAG: RNA methyltransferase [Chlorobi bacterium]|nr:MAG: tRNA methyltransferase [Chlorobi bacterium OLB7]MBK8909712.1 RNA methyltransferase [Chlorobiota bacterium]MBX7217544.1 RNA methyltransferase [Candidatus Kapabacteria bacterium]